MTTERQKELSNVLATVLKGNVDAINFCFSLSTISETIDDLIDRDVAIQEYSIINVFNLALFELQDNAFYQANSIKLLPVMKAAYIAWYDSSRLERANTQPEDRLTAFTLRGQIIDVVLACAAIIGGFGHVLSYSLQLRRFWNATETVEHYLSAFDHGSCDVTADNTAENTTDKKEEVN